MFDAVKARLARRSALKQVEARTVRTWTRDPAARRVLVVLPSGEDAREAWRFVKSFSLPASQVIPVVLPGEVTYVPAAYVSRVVRLERDDINLIGLPKQDFARRVWDMEPDVAFALTPAFDIVSAFLVGASPAPFRVGLSDTAADPFYDLMTAPGPSSATVFSLLRETMRRIEPPVLALDPGGY